MSRRTLVALSLLAFSACAEKPADTADTTAPAPATRAVVDSAREAWIAAAARDDAAAVAAMYTDDAVVVGSEGPPLVGRAAIQQALAEGFPVSTINSITSKEIVVSGDLAYDYGEYQETFTLPNSQPQTIKAHYLVTLRRQPDGSWKLSKHLTTTPPAAPAQP